MIPSSITTTSSRSLQAQSEAPPLYNSSQIMALIVVPYFSASLSLLGSGLILYVIINERKRTMKETYHRLMLGLSSVNFLTSLSIIIFGHWAVNADLVSYYPGARGNQATCSINGFFLNLIFGSMWYSFFLALSSTLKITCECKKRCLRWCEGIGHVFGSLGPIVSGTVSAARSFINPMQQLPGWCWSTDFPNGCTDNDAIECVRGEGFTEETSAGMIVFLFVAVVFCMGLIVNKVRKIELKMRHYAGETGRRRLRRTRQTGVQALWYIGIFLIVYSPIVAIMSMGQNFQEHSDGLYFAFALLIKLLSPLRGFLDAFVYFRMGFTSLLQPGRALSFLSGFVEKFKEKRLTAESTRRTARTSDMASATAAITHGTRTRETEEGEVDMTSDDGVVQDDETNEADDMETAAAANDNENGGKPTHGRPVDVVEEEGNTYSVEMQKDNGTREEP